MSLIDWLLLIVFLGCLALGVVMLFKLVYLAAIFLSFWNPITLVIIAITCVAIYAVGNFLESTWNE